MANSEHQINDFTSSHRAEIFNQINSMACDPKEVSSIRMSLMLLLTQYLATEEADRMDYGRSQDDILYDVEQLILLLNAIEGNGRSVE